MIIQIQETPNPQTLKFLPEEQLSDDISINISNIEEAEKSPLAKALFKIEGVKSVFIAPDFVSVTKIQEMDWDLINPHIVSTIMDFFASGQELISNPGSSAVNYDEFTDEVTKQIVEIIETKIRPAVAQDGGDIIFKGFEDGIVKLEMQGACSGCPSSTITLKNGIENMLRYYVPEVIAVEEV